MANKLSNINNRTPFSINLLPIEHKLLMLAIDKGASDGEASVALIKLRNSMHKNNPYVLVNGERDYGYCIIPFGRTAGKFYKDVSIQEIWSLLRFCQASKDKLKNAEEIIHDAEAYLRTRPTTNS